MAQMLSIVRTPPRITNQQKAIDDNFFTAQRLSIVRMPPRIANQQKARTLKEASKVQRQETGLRANKPPDKAMNKDGSEKMSSMVPSHTVLSIPSTGT